MSWALSALSSRGSARTPVPGSPNRGEPVSVVAGRALGSWRSRFVRRLSLGNKKGKSVTPGRKREIQVEMRGPAARRDYVTSESEGTEVSGTYQGSEKTPRRQLQVVVTLRRRLGPLLW